MLHAARRHLLHMGSPQLERRAAAGILALPGPRRHRNLLFGQAPGLGQFVCTGTVPTRPKPRPLTLPNSGEGQFGSAATAPTRPKPRPLTLPNSGEGQFARTGTVLPGCWMVWAAAQAAFSKACGMLCPIMRLATKKPVKASPAPVVSTTGTEKAFWNTHSP